ncbi:MAG: DUF1080 domain-containing protein [Phycisphaeraceae bacterium]
MPRFSQLFLLLACLIGCAWSCTTTADEPANATSKHAPGTTKGMIDIERFERPDDATQLVGQDKHTLVPEKGEKTNWTFADGVLTAPTGWDSLVTPDAYNDFVMHVEFNVNDKGGDNREADGNSGVYIQQRYEIQIQNAHGIPEDEFTTSYNGSIYRLKKPDRLVSKPAGQWQTYDIVFRAARFDGEKKTENARITVYHNGVLIHDDYELPRKTGAGKKEGPEPMPIKLQGHNNPVKFRNVWIKALELD